jgi:hypothetical protein
MHSIFRTLAALFMVPFAVVSFDSCAQATAAPDEVKNPPAKAQPAKKAESAKSEATPRKPAAKKPTAAKTAAKPQPAPPKTPAMTPGISPNPDFTVYKAGQSPPNLQGKDGKVIPSNPDAYDVSSATGKKK